MLQEGEQELSFPPALLPPPCRRGWECSDRHPDFFFHPSDVYIFYWKM